MRRADFPYKVKIPKVLVIGNTRINQTYFVVLVLFCLSYLSYWISSGAIFELVNFVTVLTVDGDLHVQHQTNSTCAPKRTRVENACVGKSEAVVKESARSTFFTTYVHQEAASEIDPLLTAQSRFTQAAEDASVTFYFTGNRRLVANQQDADDINLKSAELQTKIQGVDRKFEPGAKITLKLTDIIHAASGAEGIDVKSNGILGPELKKVGGEIGAQVNCKDGAGLSDRHCTLRFVWLSNQAQRQGMLTSDGQIYVRIYHGLRLTCLEGDAMIHGNMAFSQVIECITSLIVLYGILQKVMNLLFLNCLGHLSRLYKRVVQDDFSLYQYTADTCAHALVVASAYADLTAFHGEQGISLKCVCERFRKIMENYKQSFSQEEVSRMAAFVQFNISSRRGSAAHDKGQDLNQGLHEAHIGRKIWIGQFIEACSSAHGPDFHDMIRLFKKDRPIGRLERFYMPKNLQLFVFGQGDENFKEKFASLHQEVQSMESFEERKIIEHKALKKLEKIEFGNVNHIPSWTVEQYKIIEQRVIEQTDEWYASIDRRLEYLETVINELLPTPARPVHDTHVSLRFERYGKDKSFPSADIEPPGMDRRLEQRPQQFSQRSLMKGGAVWKSGYLDKLEDAGHKLEQQIATLERMADQNLRNA